MNKKPKIKNIPSPQKRPNFSPKASPDSVLKRTPVWRFSLMDRQGPWGWANIPSADVFIYVLCQKLKNFETMTWDEIDRNKQNHIMPVFRVSNQAQKRLKEIKLNDRDELYSLRLSGKERIWGIRALDSFYILWWDPEHTVYPVSKKHT